MNQPTLSVIIVNHNNNSQTQTCAETIKKTTKTPHEIIVVENGTQKTTQNETISRIITTPNKGFGAACNKGVKIAKGKILCFANPDTEAQKNALDTLLETIKKDTVGACGPRLATPEGKNEPWSAGEDRSPTETLKNKFGLAKNKKAWTNKKATRVDWTSGAFLMTKKELFEKIGGFDEIFFLYFEDVDYCKRVRQEGLSVIRNPKAIVIHHGGTSMESEKEKKKHYEKAQDYYFTKHYGKTQANLFKALRTIKKILTGK